MKKHNSMNSLENDNLVVSNEDKSLLPNGYPEWQKSIEQLIEISKLRAAINVNADTLKLYWNIGNSILQKQKEKGWGKKVIEQLSKDLTNRFPNDRVYSVRNLGYMKYFAQKYPDFPILQVPLAKLKGQAIRQVSLAKLGDKEQEFVQVPLAQITWYHHISLFTDFLMEMGQGFAYIGRQYHISVDDDDYYIDILMYHLKLHCYVVVELKAIEFRPEFISKLNFYISAVDEYVKSPEDKPTIGLLLCRNKSAKKVEFSLRGVTQPMGIAQYDTEKLFSDVASSLPQIEDIEALLSEE